jgi:outer membrane protein
VNRFAKLGCLLLAIALVLGFAPGKALAQVKMGYINSNKILDQYKDAQDVRKQLQELNTQWEKEARDIQKQVQDLQDQLQSQSLLLSDERKQEKLTEIQTLAQRYQTFLQEKWNPQTGEAVKKEVEFLQPVYEKINATITKIGEEEDFDYIFDVVAGNVLYASERQPDLTDKLLEELNKGVSAEGAAGKGE